MQRSPLSQPQNVTQPESEIQENPLAQRSNTLQVSITNSNNQAVNNERNQAKDHEDTEKNQQCVKIT